VFAGGSCRPLLYFAAIHFDGCGAFGAHKVVVVGGSARAVHLFTAASNGIGRPLVSERLKRPVHRCERGRIIAKQNMKLLGRDKVRGGRQGSHDGRSLFGAALHPMSLVVVSRTLNVDVIVVVLDAVFFVEVLVDFMTKSR